MSPTATLGSVSHGAGSAGYRVGRGRGVPGVVGMVGTGEGLYRYPTSTLPGPLFSHIPALRPYPRPNEVNSKVFHEVSQIGSSDGLRIDPE